MKKNSEVVYFYLIQIIISSSLTWILKIKKNCAFSCYTASLAIKVVISGKIKWTERKKTHKSKGNACKRTCITGKLEADYATCEVQIQMVTLSLSTPWRHVSVAQIIPNLDTRKRRVVRFRLRPGVFISGKRTTVTLWRCGLVKYQTYPF